MPSQEFAQPVRGSGSEPISTTQSGSFEVDNYTTGNSITIRQSDWTDADADGIYTYVVDPDSVMQMLVFFEIPDPVRYKMTLKDGTTMNPTEPVGVNHTLDFLEIDKIEFQTPDRTASVKGMWGGE
jgi:hypothetical protein